MGTTHAERRKETCKMWDTQTEITLAVPPAVVTALTLWGVTINDAVAIVMLVWSLGLLAEKLWSFARWVKRRGWQDWGT